MSNSNSASRLSQLSRLLNTNLRASFGSLSSATPSSPSKPESPTDEVLFTKNLNSRIISLNRPSAYNALNLNMIQSITQKLQVWEQCDRTNVIILKSDFPKAFCAGGDVKTIVQKIKHGDKEYGYNFFTKEYQLNHMIATCRKPIVAFMDGITMGGGVGLSIHAPFRVATERTVFAMPETAIGFFPDVGGTFFLPRLDEGLGPFLALTGHRVESGEVTRFGLATHFIPSNQLPLLQQRLSELVSPHWESVYLTLESMAMAPPEPMQSWESHRPWIHRCFANKSTIHEIREALAMETNEKAQATLEVLNTMSPTAMELTLMQLNEGKKLDLASAFRLEWGLAQVLSSHSDFMEGVTAKLIEKRTPVWSPLFSSSSSTPSIMELFARALSLQKSSDDFTLLRSITYSDYPYRLFGYPRDIDVSVSDLKWPNSNAISKLRDYFTTYFPELPKLGGLMLPKVGIQEHLNRIEQRLQAKESL